MCKYTSLFSEGGGKPKLVARDFFLFFVSMEVRLDEFDVTDMFGHNAIRFLQSLLASSPHLLKALVVKVFRRKIFLTLARCSGLLMSCNLFSSLPCCGEI